MDCPHVKYSEWTIVIRPLFENLQNQCRSLIFFREYLLDIQPSRVWRFFACIFRRLSS